MLAYFGKTSIPLAAIALHLWCRSIHWIADNKGGFMRYHCHAFWLESINLLIAILSRCHCCHCWHCQRRRRLHCRPCNILFYFCFGSSVNRLSGCVKNSTYLCVIIFGRQMSNGIEIGNEKNVREIVQTEKECCEKCSLETFNFEKGRIPFLNFFIAYRIRAKEKHILFWLELSYLPKPFNIGENVCRELTYISSYLSWYDFFRRYFSVGTPFNQLSWALFEDFRINKHSLHHVIALSYSQRLVKRKRVLFSSRAIDEILTIISMVILPYISELVWIFRRCFLNSCLHVIFLCSIEVKCHLYRMMICSK